MTSTAIKQNLNTPRIGANTSENTGIKINVKGAGFQRGRLIDSPIKGVKFECGGKSGFTNEDGTFECTTLPVEFRVGKAKIGKMEKLPRDSVVTVQDLAGVPRENVDDEKVVSLAVFIQSLDNDGYISSSIVIDQNIAKKFTEEIDIQKLHVDEVKELLEEVGVKRIVDEEKAIEHIVQYQNIINRIRTTYISGVRESSNSVDQNSQTTEDTSSQIGIDLPTVATTTTPKTSSLSTGQDDTKRSGVDTKNTTKAGINWMGFFGGLDGLKGGVKYLKVKQNIYINDKKDTLIYIDPELDKIGKLIYEDDKLSEITKNIYKNLSDDYDFIFLITNNKIKPEEVNYSVVFNKVKNSVKGIGLPIYNHGKKYGSKGKLQGILHFTYRSAISKGATLHEIAHNWANKFIDFDAKIDGSDGYRLGNGPHWGFTGFFGGKGQLGGFDASSDDLRDEHREYIRSKNTIWKLYSAKTFGWVYNNGNSIPYNDVELYLMGMIPKSEVKDLIVPIPWGSALTAEEKSDLLHSGITQKGRTYFVAGDMVRKSWSTILSDHDVEDRDPSSKKSQKKFRILTVLLDNKMPTTSEVNIISVQMRNLALKDDDGNPKNYNFWEATRGKGELIISNIDKSLKTKAEDIFVEENFISEKVNFRGKIYRTIKSPYTGRIWLDRNIGADRVCKDFDDGSCYGYYFQFGRGFDGHQLKDSPITIERKTTLNGNDDAFVVIGNSKDYDWLVDGVDDDLSARIDFMKDSTGNGVCPTGFRTPTLDEFLAETSSNEVMDPFPGKSIDSNFLRLPMNGYRNSQNDRGELSEPGSRGAYWTITAYNYSDSRRIRHILFRADQFLGYGTRYFANADAVRCIKDDK
jgi:hypothetical protein